MEDQKHTAPDSPEETTIQAPAAEAAPADEQAGDRELTESADKKAEEKALLKEEKEEELEIEEYVCKLTPAQQNIWQIVLGWAFGFLIWFSLALGLMHPENTLLNWLFVIIFAIAMFGRNMVERKTGVQLRKFMKHFLISLIVFLALFVILGPVTNVIQTPV